MLAFTAFLEKTWFLWWIFAATVILRWFHTQSLDESADLLESSLPGNEQSQLLPADFSSRPLRPSGFQEGPRF
jgi:hypothetical protein